jgi:hypothetical protein
MGLWLLKPAKLESDNCVTPHVDFLPVFSKRRFPDETKIGQNFWEVFTLDAVQASSRSRGKAYMRDLQHTHL